MTGVLTLLGLWLGVTFASVAGLLWVASRETVAELPDEPVPYWPTGIGHAGISGLVAAECEWCLRAEDAGALVWFDLDAWEAELRETAS